MAEKIESTDYSTRSTATAWIAAVAICASLGRFIALGAYPLVDTTEARYAEIAREMLVTGNWVTPHLNPSTPFWGKPPLSFWLTALSLHVFGVNEFGARLPTYLLAMGILGLTYLLASHFYNSRVGVLSCAILSTTGLFFVLSGTVMPDCTLAFCVTLSMTAFLLALEQKKSRSKTVWGYLFFVGLALSILTKGLVGCVLVALAVGIWTTWHSRWRDVWSGIPWITGTLLFLAIATPWYVMAELRTPGFLKYFFVGEHLMRYLKPSWQGDMYGHAHEEPFGTIWVFWLLSSCPWILVLGVALVWLKRKSSASSPKLLAAPLTSYFILWTLTPEIFFTAAKNILTPYVLPGMPALAVLTALALERVRNEATSQNRPWILSRWISAVGLGFVPAILLIVAFTVLPGIFELRSQRRIVRSFQAFDSNHNATLVYTDRMPYSAAFYSHGEARDLPGDSITELEADLHDAKQDYYVIEKSDLRKFPPDGLTLTEEVVVYGKYTLRREMDTQDRPVPAHSK